MVIICWMVRSVTRALPTRPRNVVTVSRTSAPAATAASHSTSTKASGPKRATSRLYESGGGKVKEWRAILVLSEKRKGVALSPNDVSSGVLELVLNAGPVGKTVLLILLGFSIVSWALIVEKWWQFRRGRRQTLAFLRLLGEGRRGAPLTAVERIKTTPPPPRSAPAGQEVVGASGWSAVP